MVEKYELNHTTFVYHNVTKNLVLRVNRGILEGARRIEDMRVAYRSELLERFVHRIVTANPGLVLYAGEIMFPHWDPNTSAKWDARIEAVSVTVGGEVVGRVATGRGRLGHYLELHNDRISAELMQRTSKRTHSLDKAIKIFERTFSTKTLPERAAALRRKLFSSANRATRIAGRTFSSNYTGITTALEPYIIENWSQFRDAAIAAGVTEVAADSIVSEYNTVQSLAQLSESGVSISIEDGVYTVLRDTRDAELYTTDTLPVGFKRGIGMLKLVPDDTLLEGIGLRDTESTYRLFASLEHA